MEMSPCGRTDGQTNKQVKIELLSLWTVWDWVSQLYIWNCTCHILNAVFNCHISGWHIITYQILRTYVICFALEKSLWIYFRLFLLLQCIHSRSYLDEWNLKIDKKPFLKIYNPAKNISKFYQRTQNLHWKTAFIEGPPVGAEAVNWVVKD